MSLSTAVPTTVAEDDALVYTCDSGFFLSNMSTTFHVKCEGSGYTFVYGSTKCKEMCDQDPPTINNGDRVPPTKDDAVEGWFEETIIT